MPTVPPHLAEDPPDRDRRPSPDHPAADPDAPAACRADGTEYVDSHGCHSPPFGATVPPATSEGQNAVTISVFLLDDHEIVRRGIAQLLTAEDDIEVVGEAGTAAQALARMPALRPDVAILDVRLPDGDGVTVCRDVRSAITPPPACLMLTSYSDDEALFGAIMAGASGYLLKQVAGTDLVGAVRTLAAGGSLLDPKATQVVLERLRKGAEPEDPRFASLSPQEKRILELIADGLTNRQIGAEMYLAEKTVKNYVSSLLHKLGMSRRTEAAVYATEIRQRENR
jgi:DNA-binding NarL/FixJ family response regulator